MEIVINKAILHIADTNIEMPVLANKYLDMDSDIEGFIISHIEKAFLNDDCKICSFNDSSEFYVKLISIGSENLIGFTQSITSRLFSIMRVNNQIPSADLLFITASINGQDYFILLKLNYRESYIHYVKAQDGVSTTSIIKQRTVLPSPGNKVDEVFFINMSTFEIRLLEKKYDVDGAKDFYISPYLLQCKNTISEKSKFALVRKISSKISSQYLDNGNVSSKDLQKIYTTVTKQPYPSISDISNELYGNNPTAKTEFLNALIGNNVNPDDKINVSNSALKRYSKQSVRSASGVEIKIPFDIYNSDSVEFINNPDGSVYLLIKNIII